jgi:DNA-binding NarL/FixJ family response regulator
MSATVLIGDDHPIVRFGLTRLIDREPDLSVIADASDGAEAVDAVLELEVDLAVLDVAMPRKTGLQAAEELSARRPRTHVLILSMYDNEQYLLAAARAGASGYVLKSDADEEIVDACRRALYSNEFICPASTTPAVREEVARIRGGQVQRTDVLTRREIEILKLVAEGHSSREIADQLTISVKTVDRHRSNLMGKLNVSDRVHLARHAIRRGLIEP